MRAPVHILFIFFVCLDSVCRSPLASERRHDPLWRADLE
jgi:protein-tyrosine-phosphatase